MDSAADGVQDIEIYPPSTRKWPVDGGGKIKLWHGSA